MITSKLFPTSISGRKDLNNTRSGIESVLQNNITESAQIKMDKYWNILYSILSNASIRFCNSIMKHASQSAWNEIVSFLEFDRCFLVKSVLLKLDVFTI